jgi:cysteine desulfurase
VPPPRTYLDAAATAPLHPVAREALLASVDDGWADPRRLHTEGRRARLLLEGAREAVADRLGARTDEVGFAGSHTEAVHCAVLGAAAARRRVGRRIVTSRVEHSSVLHAARYAAEEVEEVGVDTHGRVDADGFASAVRREGTALACLQTANGEVATTQPVDAVADACRDRGVPLLVDAAASAGHAEPPATWDLLVADPAAWGGPGGIGVLAVKAGTRWLSPYPEHDGLERTPGQVFVPAALAAAASLQAVDAARAVEASRRRALVDVVRVAAAAVPDTQVLGDPVDRLPHVVTFSCLYVDGEALLGELDRAGYAVGSGSACTSATLRPSHVLEAMGVLTHGNIRVGLPVGVEESAVHAFCAELAPAVARVRSLLGAHDL